jgi:hypothetical protein
MSKKILIRKVSHRAPRVPEIGMTLAQMLVALEEMPPWTSYASYGGRSSCDRIDMAVVARLDPTVFGSYVIAVYARPLYPIRQQDYYVYHCHADFVAAINRVSLSSPWARFARGQVGYDLHRNMFDAWLSGKMPSENMDHNYSIRFVAD